MHGLQGKDSWAGYTAQLQLGRWKGKPQVAVERGVVQQQAIPEQHKDSPPAAK